MNKERRSFWIGAIMVVLGSFGFAMKGIFIKQAYGYDIDATDVIALRMIFSFPFYVLILLLSRARGAKLPSFTRKQLFSFGIIATLGYYVASYVNFVGLQYVTVNVERIVLFTYPTWVLLINKIFFKKEITKIQWIAIGVSYLGIVITFVGSLSLQAQNDLLIGVSLVILSGVVYAVYLITSEATMKRMTSLQFTCLSMMIATIPVLVHTYFVNGLEIWNHDIDVYYYMIKIAIFSTVLPTLLIMNGVKRVGADNMSIIASAGPVFTILLAYYILGEIMTYQQVFGTVLVLFGIFLISSKGSKGMKK